MLNIQNRWKGDIPEPLFGVVVLEMTVIKRGNGQRAETGKWLVGQGLVEYLGCGGIFACRVWWNSG